MKFIYLIALSLWLISLSDIIAQPKQGLIAYYPFNGNANDESGNGNSGTIMGAPAWVTDRTGKQRSALHFDGSYSYVVVDPLKHNFNENSDFTISCWVKFDRFITQTSIVYSGSWNPNNFVISIGLYNDELRFGTGKQQVAWSEATYSTSQLQAGVWYNLISVYKDKQLHFYINSENIGNTIFQNTGTRSSSLPFSIGAAYNEANSVYDYFNGAIDEIRVYNRALSSSEINQLNNENIKSDTKVYNAIIFVKDERGKPIKGIEVHIDDGKACYVRESDVNGKVQVDILDKQFKYCAYEPFKAGISKYGFVSGNGFTDIFGGNKIIIYDMPKDAKSFYLMLDDGLEKTSFAYDVYELWEIFKGIKKPKFTGISNPSGIPGVFDMRLSVSEDGKAGWLLDGIIVDDLIKIMNYFKISPLTQYGLGGY